MAPKPFGKCGNLGRAISTWTLIDSKRCARLQRRDSNEKREQWRTNGASKEEDGIFSHGSPVRSETKQWKGNTVYTPWFHKIFMPGILVAFRTTAYPQRSFYFALSGTESRFLTWDAAGNSELCRLDSIEPIYRRFFGL
jgi:hypothetical protein